MVKNFIKLGIFHETSPHVDDNWGGGLGICGNWRFDPPPPISSAVYPEIYTPINRLQATSSSSYQRVEKVQKVEQVVTSKQFVQSGQSFIVETGDPDADAVSYVICKHSCSNAILAAMPFESILISFWARFWLCIFSSYHCLSIVKLPLGNSKSFLVKGKLYLGIILVNRAIRSHGNICDNVCMILSLNLFKIVQAIMKALEDARKQDPNVKVAEVTITKQETEGDE